MSYWIILEALNKLFENIHFGPHKRAVQEYLEGATTGQRAHALTTIPFINRQWSNVPL